MPPPKGGRPPRCGTRAQPPARAGPAGNSGACRFTFRLAQPRTRRTIRRPVAAAIRSSSCFPIGV